MHSRFHCVNISKFAKKKNKTSYNDGLYPIGLLNSRNMKKIVLAAVILLSSLTPALAQHSVGSISIKPMNSNIRQQTCSACHLVPCTPCKEPKDLCHTREPLLKQPARKTISTSLSLRTYMLPKDWPLSSAYSLGSMSTTNIM